jgi:hypothetical protein
MRQYRPVHNIGHFRYLECSACGEDAVPSGDITLWDEILFPFDPELQNQQKLTKIPVVRSEKVLHQEVEETYFCDANGTVTVVIANTLTAYERRYKIGRWAENATRLLAGRRRRAPLKGRTVEPLAALRAPGA